MSIDISIQPIGEYFQNDKDGHAINPSSWGKIFMHWHPVIELVKQHYIDHLGEKLHSVYLRGSLVRGMAIDDFSDMDSFAVVKEKGFRWEDAPWTKKLNKTLSSKYEFVREIECMLSSIDDLRFLENPNLSMIIKTQSLCIYGNDLNPLIPKFKADKSMMLNYRWIETDFQELFVNEKWSELDFKNFLKILIRTGFEIVMEKEGRFTPDLYLCYKSFSGHFPEWKSAMEKALFCYLNPSKTNEKAEQIILKLSEWLIEKVKTQLL